MRIQLNRGFPGQYTDRTDRKLKRDLEHYNPLTVGLAITICKVFLDAEDGDPSVKTAFFDASYCDEEDQVGFVFKFYSGHEVLVVANSLEIIAEPLPKGKNYDWYVCEVGRIMLSSIKVDPSNKKWFEMLERKVRHIKHHFVSDVKTASDWK